MSKKKNSRQQPATDAHPDPITGESGCHPLGAGLGAAAGGAAGAVLGAMGGPFSAVAGAAAGAVVGGLVGKDAAEAVDHTAEDAYWRDNYRDRPYVAADADYEVYGPAYRFGWEARNRFPGRTFEDVEPVLHQRWDKSPESAQLGWDRARQAVKDAWNHVAV